MGHTGENPAAVGSLRSAKADNAEDFTLAFTLTLAGQLRSAAGHQRGNPPSLANFKRMLSGLRALGWPSTLGPYELQLNNQELIRQMNDLQLRTDGRVGIA